MCVWWSAGEDEVIMECITCTAQWMSLCVEGTIYIYIYMYMYIQWMCEGHYISWAV